MDVMGKAMPHIFTPTLQIDPVKAGAWSYEKEARRDIKVRDQTPTATSQVTKAPWAAAHLTPAVLSIFTAITSPLAI
jgi:hypothetical protein